MYPKLTKMNNSNIIKQHFRSLFGCQIKNIFIPVAAPDFDPWNAGPPSWPAPASAFVTPGLSSSETNHWIQIYHLIANIIQNITLIEDPLSGIIYGTTVERLCRTLLKIDD